MDERRSCFEGALRWYIHATRLAVAVAIIKISPPGGARLFTESLAERLKQQEESWRSRAKGLKEDLLHLKQELLLTHALLKTRSNAEPGPWMASQDDQKQFRADSECDAENISQTQSCRALIPYQTPTPPNSQIFTLRPGHWSQEQKLIKHTEFLLRLSVLQGGFEPALCTESDVVWESVVQLMDSMVEAFRQAHAGQPLGHSEQLHQASKLLAQTLSPEKARHGFSEQHSHRVEELMREMICLMLSNQQLNALSVQMVLSKCLLALGGSRVLKSPLVRLLMSLVIQMAQKLWDACEGFREDHDPVDWICYQNSFYAFWVLEHLAADGDEGVNHELRQQLESKAFPLADEFPLFSLYMWRVAGLFRTTPS
ncbi:hypothetical protein DNTS_032395 [Danionella cerebrum]|uniref:Meiosis-specific protein MEI4 n=1 Tax=Danionella cerebrum TaxID=2873325 RepID=A0A553N128_9TELE|nr:hypothetical protein DNTS_032395 [Danionella translucida]